MFYIKSKKNNKVIIIAAVVYQVFYVHQRWFTEGFEIFPLQMKEVGSREADWLAQRHAAIEGFPGFWPWQVIL